MFVFVYFISNKKIKLNIHEITPGRFMGLTPRVSRLTTRLMSLPFKALFGGV